MILPDRRIARRQSGDTSFVFSGSEAKNTQKVLVIRGANNFKTDGGLDLHVF